MATSVPVDVWFSPVGVPHGEPGEQDLVFVIWVLTTRRASSRTSSLSSWPVSSVFTVSSLASSSHRLFHHLVVMALIPTVFTMVTLMYVHYRLDTHAYLSVSCFRHDTHLSIYSNPPDVTCTFEFSPIFFLRSSPLDCAVVFHA